MPFFIHFKQLYKTIILKVVGGVVSDEKIYYIRALIKSWVKYGVLTELGVESTVNRFIDNNPKYIEMLLEVPMNYYKGIGRPYDYKDICYSIMRKSSRNYAKNKTEESLEKHFHNCMIAYFIHYVWDVFKVSGGQRSFREFLEACLERTSYNSVKKSFIDTDNDIMIVDSDITKVYETKLVYILVNGIKTNIKPHIFMDSSGSNIDYYKSICDYLLQVSNTSTHNKLKKMSLIGQANTLEYTLLETVEFSTIIFSILGLNHRLIGIDSKKLKAIFEIAEKYGSKSAEFTQTLKKISDKVNRKAVVELRSRYKGLTKDMISDKALLNTSIMLLSDMNYRALASKSSGGKL